jgi:hypothetical protein
MGIVVKGEVYKTNNSGTLEVIEYNNAKSVLVRFIDTGYETVVSADQLRFGRVSDRLKPTLYGKGYLGVDKVSTKSCHSYIVWSGMIRRCYSGEVDKHPTYQDCTVCDEWLDYSNFYHWYQDNYVGGFELDKDLVVLGNKIYSPEFCNFVPQAVNSLLTDSGSARGEYPRGVTKKGKKFRAQCLQGLGRPRWMSKVVITPDEAFVLYKSKKEEVIKEVAEYYKGVLPDVIYQNLMNYEVTDDSEYFKQNTC